MERIINNKCCADIQFIVEGKSFYAHKIILAARVPKLFSYVCESEAQADSQTRVGGMAALPLPLPFDAFSLVLRFVYTDYADLSLDVAMDVLGTAQYLDVERMVTLLERELVDHHLCVENAAWMLSGADAAQVISLRTACMSLILREFDDVSKTDSFRMLSRDLILEILQRR